MPARPAAVAHPAQVITIAVRGTAYLPGYLAVLAGVPTTLVLRSDHVAGCSRGLVIGGLGIRQVLPPDGQTTIQLGRPAPGTMRYTSATGMYSGAIAFTSGTAATRLPAPRATAGRQSSPGMRRMLPAG